MRAADARRRDLYHERSGFGDGDRERCSSVLMRREDALQYPMTHDELHEDYIVWLSIKTGKPLPV